MSEKVKTIAACENEIKDALDVIADETINMSMEQRFDDLGQTIIAQSYDILMSIREKGKRTDPDVEYRQIESVKQFKIIASTIQTLKRTGRITSVPNADFDAQLMKKIKDKKSSMGEIVVSVPRD